MRIDTFSSSAALLAAALLLAACADDATEPGSSQPACLALAHTAEVDWQPAAEIGGDGALLSVWGTGPCDVYTVGGQPDAGVAYHFDGTDWTALELPAVPLLKTPGKTGKKDPALFQSSTRAQFSSFFSNPYRTGLTHYLRVIGL